MRKRINFIFSTLVLSACVSGEVTRVPAGCSAGNRAACDQSALIEACTHTVNRYAFSRDRLLYDEYGALFTSDARFQIADQAVTQGRTAIVEALRTRGPLIPTRHFSQVVDMQITGEESAKGLSYVTVYKYQKDADNAEQGGKTGPWRLAEYHDTFKWVGGRCLIKSRKVRIISRTD